jgi:hypothetical protein
LVRIAGEREVSQRNVGGKALTAIIGLFLLAKIDSVHSLNSLGVCPKLRQRLEFSGPFR